MGRDHVPCCVPRVSTSSPGKFAEARDSVATLAAGCRTRALVVRLHLCVGSGHPRSSGQSWQIYYDVRKAHQTIQFLSLFLNKFLE